ncbi:MAG: hypothetical protein GTO53_00815 [Planctomycetales bacterium]|nr:hypothetical protein [Planctomycetales bacterium]NIM07719.1 hypothetical protein [Planctomycetales bacterium]NIN07222.1 hypothetical protein [Planctomycetales bacterium]NIN76315.1 hypothetical protein [Planctomycetales bacterium]NIO33520.1 hypothetical protein [Planctomycetales bacterium]
MATSLFQRRLDWLCLALICTYLLLFQGNRLMSDRLGFSPQFELYLIFFFLIATAAGLTFRAGPIVFWPLAGAFIGTQLIIYRLDAWQNILLFTIVGVLFGFGMQTLLQKTE